MEDNKLNCDVYRDCIYSKHNTGFEGTFCQLCRRNPIDNRIDMFQDEPEPDVYRGDKVIKKEPWDIQEIEGYSAGFCKCGNVLHIKTPKFRDIRAIECPDCGFIISLFCGEIGEKAGMECFR